MSLYVKGVSHVFILKAIKNQKFPVFFLKGRLTDIPGAVGYDMELHGRYHGVAYRLPTG